MSYWTFKEKTIQPHTNTSRKEKYSKNHTWPVQEKKIMNIEARILKNRIHKEDLQIAAELFVPFT